MEREKLKQERINNLTHDAREFLKGHQTFQFSGKDGFRTLSGDPKGLETFFKEAQEKFQTSSKERFAQFVKDNQDRFTQMTEQFGQRSVFSDFDSKFSGLGFPDKSKLFEGFGGKSQTQSWKEESSSSKRETSSESMNKEFRDFSSSGNQESKLFKSTESQSSQSSNFQKVFSSSSGFSESRETLQRPSEMFSSGLKGTPNQKNRFTFGHFGMDSDSFFSDDLPKFGAFGGFARFTPIIVSPGKKGLQMHTSRSTFEYCGSTNSFRISTEQVTAMHKYDDSESENSEEDEDDPHQLPVVLSKSRNSVKEMKMRKRSRPLSLETETSTRTSTPTLSEAGDSESQFSIPCTPLPLEYPDPRQEKSFKIVQELISTEKTYVTILHLIYEVFQKQVEEENKKRAMFPGETIAGIFSNVKSLYQLHHDFLLPKLTERIGSWEKDPRIGDIMKGLAPFLKMYTEYVKNFDNAMKLLKVWCKKSPRFAAIVDQIQYMEESANLSVEHHMLCPVQRLPRYRLLLMDYLKRLASHSSDREDAQKALHLVSVAANHANDAMRRIDQFKQLLETQERLAGALDLVSPSRILIKEGRIWKISARSGDHQERYLFLFSDLLLLCSSRLLPVPGTVGGTQLKLRAQFSILGLQVFQGDNLETPHSFYLSDTHKTIELYTKNGEEKEAWLEALVGVIEDFCQRKSSILGSSVIGKEPPEYLRMDSVAKCMDCSSSFGTFKRRHHCHACGIVICSKCAGQRTPLPWIEGSKSSRVCRQCHEEIERPSSEVSDSNHSEDKENLRLPIQRAAAILQVPASKDSVVSGELMFKGSRSKTWQRRFFALRADGVLYSYENKEDDRALAATPVPGHEIQRGIEIAEKEKEKCFRLSQPHTRRSYVFMAPSPTEATRWWNAMEECIGGKEMTS